MTINKYFMFVPTVSSEERKDNHPISNKETQRQALVKKAQEQGGL